MATEGDRVACAIDMAKALSLMGESKKEVEYADRHFQQAHTMGP